MEATMTSEQAWTGYENAVHEAADRLYRLLRIVWFLVKRTRWRGAFLASVWKWGTLSGDVPAVVVPNSTNLNDTLLAIRQLILMKKQAFPLPSRIMFRRTASLGLTGFQANCAVNKVVSMFLGEGFVVYSDQARMYPQYAGKYKELLESRYGDLGWTDPRLDCRAASTMFAINWSAPWHSWNNTHLTPEYHLRARRTDARMNAAYRQETLELATANRWLHERFPEYTWTADLDWAPGLSCGGRIAPTLEKLKAYFGRKPYNVEMEAAWKQRGDTNDERLRLWREWWQTNVVAALA